MPAAVSTGYVPPFATTAAATASTAATKTTQTSLSFAQIGTATGTATAAIVDSTGGVDSSSLLSYFTRPYIDAHTLSIPTWRYAYFLWFIILFVLVFWSAAHHLPRLWSRGRGGGGSSMGAWFRKYSIRRISWGGKVKRDVEGKTVGKGRSRVRWASPTYAQMATIVGLIGVALCLSLVGPDYIAPTTCVFGGDCGYSAYYGAKGPPKSTYRAKKRDLDIDLNLDLADSADTPPPPTPASLDFAPKSKRGVNNPKGWAPFNDPLLASSNIDIEFNAWTAAARLGLIAYAMLPLAVTLALKQWPFNIWATPFLTNYHFDKTAILHRWSGRVIWLFASGHVAAWLYQLVIDKDPFGRPVLVPVWEWYRFTAGAVAWVLLTIIMLFSFKSIRTRYYEFFYWSHVGLVLLFLAACIIHHKPLMWWPIIGAIVWGAERGVRFLVFLHINGFTRGIGFRVPKDGSRRRSGERFVGGVEKGEREKAGRGWDESVEPLAGQQEGRHAYPPMSSSSPDISRAGRGSSPAPSYHHSPSPSYAMNVHSSARRSSHHLPPSGFASAQLLPGRTVRLTLHTATPLRWRPGQHVFLSIPAVRLFEAHPYTIVSIDDRARGIAPVGGADVGSKRGSEVVLLVRAQKGFSKALWDYVARARKQKEDQGLGAGECARGVEMRALVSWPLGSSARVEWEGYESLLIVCGGTGVTFGVSVLEYTCRRMARRQAEEGGKYRTTRVRFVWILREFAHLSWVAPVLRRCLDMLDPSQLQIDLFVSRDAPRPPRRTRRNQQPTFSPSTDDFAPPSAPFARQARRESSQSLDSDLSDVSDVEDDGASSVGGGAYTRSPDYGDQIDSVTDLVLFEGEDDERTAGEVEMSSKVRSAGKIRRALSRKKSKVQPPKLDLHSPTPRHQQQRSIQRSQSDFSTLSYEQDVGYSHLSHGGVGGSQQEGHLPRGAAAPSPYARSGSAFAETGSFADLSFAGVDDHHASEVQSLAGDSSIRHLVGTGGGKRGSNGGGDAEPLRAEEADFQDVTEEDQEDLEVVAELAKPGYPKLKEIMEEEVNRSSGKTMVACCGPNGLNTLIRHLVSDRIDLAKVVKGDPRGQVSLTCEDFSF